MRTSWVLMVVMFAAAGGCATIANTGRADQFDAVARKYQQAMKLADFETAMEHMEMKAIRERIDPARFRDVKISDYQVRKRLPSEDGRSVRETIRIEYYRTTSAILRHVQHEQVWKFDEEAGTWLLQTAWPDFQ